MVSSVPAITREEPDSGLAAQTAPVLAERFEKLLTEHDVAVLPALAALDVDHVSRSSVNVRDPEAGQFRAAESCGIECHQKSALEGRSGGFNKGVYFFPAKDGRQVQNLLRVRRQVCAP